jgi:hypothetical protein
MWLLWTFAGLVLAVMAILIPRVRFSGEAAPGMLHLELRGLGFLFAYDRKTGQIAGQFLNFRFRRREGAANGSRDKAGRVSIHFGSKDSRQPSRGIGETANSPPRTAPETGKQIKSSASRSLLRGATRADLSLLVALAKRLLTLNRRLLKSIRADYIHVELTIATPDPLWTGVLFGVLQPVAVFDNPPTRTFQVGADFEHESPQASAEWSFSTRPFRCLWVVGVWLISLPWGKLYRIYRQRKA